MQTPNLEIHHVTTYNFDRLTTIMPHIVRLRPAPHCLMPIHFYKLEISPSQHQIHWQLDPFSNYEARLFFPEKSMNLVIDVRLKTRIVEVNPFDFFLETGTENYPFAYDALLHENLYPYLLIKEKEPLLKAWVSNVDKSSQNTIDFLISLNKKLHSEIDYILRLEEGVQSCEVTLASKAGSCRDSAWLLIQILRHLGLASRFVSGYQIQLDTVDPENDDKLRDSTGLHAWAEVFIPGAGWIGLDPTTGLFAAQGYIPLACTPDPLSAAPITGTTSPCGVIFDYQTTIERIAP